jgi:hypothetical protein
MVNSTSDRPRQNKANSHYDADREIGVPGQPNVRNKANLRKPGRHRAGLLCKTKPIPGHGGGAGDEGQMRQTKPISGRPEFELNPLQKKICVVCARLTTSAKQSQFPATPGGTWPLGREPWGHRATSPRCPASGNKANCQRSSRSDGGGIRRRMPATSVQAGGRILILIGS